MPETTHSPIDVDCPKCGDTLYPWKHHVQCSECGAQVECNSDVVKGIFGFVCAKCQPAAITEGVITAKTS